MVNADLLNLARDVAKLIDDDWRNALEEMTGGQDDVEAGRYRFIHEDEIDAILLEELSHDDYILGCFTPWILSRATGIDTDIFDLGTDGLDLLRQYRDICLNAIGLFDRTLRPGQQTVCFTLVAFETLLINPNVLIAAGDPSLIALEREPSVSSIVVFQLAALQTQ